MMANVTVRDNPDENRFEAHIDDRRVGVAHYMIANRLMIFTHTEVDPAYEGQGIGSTLVRHALDAVRSEGSRTVLPLCPFVKAWIDRHEAYHSLVFAAQPSTVKD